MPDGCAGNVKTYTPVVLLDRVDLAKPGYNVVLNALLRTKAQIYGFME